MTTAFRLLAKSRRAGRTGHGRPALQEGWVIANHILVSFHVAFISSVLAIPGDLATRAEVLRFIFLSPETIASALFTYIVFHAAISFHELGHFLEAARLRALNDAIQDDVEKQLAQPFPGRMRYLAGLFIGIPYGRAVGIKRDGLNYYPDAPYNLAVAAAGPRASRNVARIALPLAAVLIVPGLLFDGHAALYVGRLALGLGLVTLLDFLLADPGKYREFRDRERLASEAASAIENSGRWNTLAPRTLERVVNGRMQEAAHPRLGQVSAPWQFRNCGMGGRHTEKEYPESNISMQEAMFLVLGAANTLEAQEMTIRLQTRLKEILEKADGCRVMGIGLEGGLAPYVDPGEFELPELRLWAMMKQAIEECGYRPGEDVAIALDPALTELEIAYREEFNMPDSVGMYLFWRDHSKKVLDREAVLAVYQSAIEEHDIPILSIEDGFSEFDDEGWRLLLDELGDRVLVIGDDLVTTNDKTIEQAADGELVNAALIKANQIGSLYETLLAILVSLGKGLHLVISHRSKSPNDDMEAHLALAVNSLGLKCGGGANTERLVKYQAVASQMDRVLAGDTLHPEHLESAVVERVSAREEPTNAGIPTVGVDVRIRLPGSSPDQPVRISFHGATPLGTSAGSGEAVHLIDRGFERYEYSEVAKHHPTMLRETEPGVLVFDEKLTSADIEATADDELAELFRRSRRYNGKGCLHAVDNVHAFLAPALDDADLAGWDLLRIDRMLLQLELATALRRGKIDDDADEETRVAVMQRKQNLGMNAILATSLALARGVAHIRGQELYEFLREELLAIIERISAGEQVAIKGSRFDDYLSALRECNRKIIAKNGSLYRALRACTGIYEASGSRPAAPAPKVANSEKTSIAPVSFSLREQELIESLDIALLDAFHEDGNGRDTNAALRSYWRFLAAGAGCGTAFEITNHRIFRSGDRILVPYNANGRIAIHTVGPDSDEVVCTSQLPGGALVTDRFLLDLAGMEAEPVDLWQEMHHLRQEDMPPVHITRLRDLASLLEALNGCGSQYEAIYLLRNIVVQLYIRARHRIAGAKNLMPEVTRIHEELNRFLNGPFSHELRLSARILVRRITALVAQPKLIDQIFQDTIDLAEVHVRGSDITNEIRRRAHHALGRNTLVLARAYLDWLETGVAHFPDHQRDVPVEADEAACGNPAILALTRRVVENLDRLLGSGQLAERIDEWRSNYAAELLRCESSNSLSEELESAVTEGIHEANRWVYLHRLRSIASKARGGNWDSAAADALEDIVSSMQATVPGSDRFNPEKAERRLRRAVANFSNQLLNDHQERLFEELDALVDSSNRGLHFETFERTWSLRRRVEDLVGDGVFESQRYLLHQLDCILEELGYVALRQVASDYEEKGLDLSQCLKVISLCAGNLERDGLYSRQILDLSVMLVNRIRTPRELLDVLAQVQRHYHKQLHRVHEGYEVIAKQQGFEPGDVRAMLNNCQRELFDLNSLIHFSDIARAYISVHEDELEARSSSTRGEKPWDFVHLSHAEDIARRVEDRDEISLQARYGGKGSGLMYIAHLGIPTRDGFIIPTVLPRLGLHEIERERLEHELVRHTQILEKDILRDEDRDLHFGDPAAPLLLAVRGGSVFSMPGMLTTIVFVGMTLDVCRALAEEDEWFAWDAFRRFLVTFAMSVWRFDLETLDLVEQFKRQHGVQFKADLPGSAMREICEASVQALREGGYAGIIDRVVNDAELQLYMSVQAVIASWSSERAQRYRAVKQISDGWHTGVIVQQMASGNRTNSEPLHPGMDEMNISLTGVIPHTRITGDGMREFTGDVKFSACGDDLVGGMTDGAALESVTQLHTLAPMLERRLSRLSYRLRHFLGSDVEIEFTVERGVLSVLQTRTAMLETRGSRRTFAGDENPIGRGIGIRGGAFRGMVAFDEDDARRLADEAVSADGVDGVLLLLENPVPDEIPLILSVDGLLAAKGGSTSHAAVAVHSIDERAYTAVMGVNELCVSNREAVLLDESGRVRHKVAYGDVLSIHGRTGEVFAGSLRVVGVDD